MKARFLEVLAGVEAEDPRDWALEQDLDSLHNQLYPPVNAPKVQPKAVVEKAVKRFVSPLLISFRFSPLLFRWRICRSAKTGGDLLSCSGDDVASWDWTEDGGWPLVCGSFACTLLS